MKNLKLVTKEDKSEPIYCWNCERVTKEKIPALGGINIVRQSQMVNGVPVVGTGGMTHISLCKQCAKMVSIVQLIIAEPNAKMNEHNGKSR